MSVVKVETNGSRTPISGDELAKFVTDFFPANKKIEYGGESHKSSKFTIKSLKNVGTVINRIPTGKYTLTIKGVGGGKDDTIDIVLNVGILSFDYREY